MVSSKFGAEMRYSRIRDLLALALAMASTREGLSLADMQARLGVARRTAERLRDALEAAFPNIERIDDDGRVRRWRLPHGALSGLLAPTAVELAELEAAARRLREDGASPERAAALESLAGRVRAAMREGALRRTATDVAALMEAEGTAARPGPQPTLPAGLLGTIREAILACREINFLYLRPNVEPALRRARPLGLLYGARPYLVASLPGTPGDPTIFRLDRMRDLVLREEAFERDPSFDLSEWAGQSFGVWRSEPDNVVLRFSADAAEDAKGFRFHRTQQLEALPDGRLLVRFTAAGRLEMIHHLAIWGTTVEVLAPKNLRKELAEWARHIARQHRRSPGAGEAPPGL
ncbi:YafY family protein [Roseomonas sp. KE2513]|uniref:helix-turn-helix transcriptional regulator n=1 Tax=Roseomonas sp. KE2513 TaxID=2479202 RepID=UPI0018DEFD4A|nr:WYL domain-containing protein [Roseomonas sp. KE2513]